MFLVDRSEEEPSFESQVQSAILNLDTVGVPDPSQLPSTDSRTASVVRNGSLTAEPTKSNKRKGVNSDEVRVMQKVLVNEVSCILEEIAANAHMWMLHPVFSAAGTTDVGGVCPSFEPD